ncbi:hypothetical protein GCM10022215_14730 [Nocardioides fonticola]|uniref:HTH tetR-type domain-containing protein n=1 Tax=Nocardioides fonticola TaxID=450363 RepID=A0ABP7XGG3_9ACTN
MTNAEQDALITAMFTDTGLAEAEVPAKRPNKRGEQTRERIVRAATECFAEYGYTRTRISDIVHRAGTAQGNFYRHFTSLDDVFLAAMKPGLEELATASRRRPGHGIDRAALIDVHTDYLTTYARHRHILRLLREAAASSENDGFLQLWLRMRGDFVGRTRRWLQRLTESGDLTGLSEAELDLLAEALGCLTEQLAYVHVGLPSATPRRERIEELGAALGDSWYRMLRP